MERRRKDHREAMTATEARTDGHRSLDPSVFEPFGGALLLVMVKRTVAAMWSGGGTQAPQWRGDGDDAHGTLGTTGEGTDPRRLAVA